MRMMLKIQLPVQRGNEAIGDGTLPRVIGATLERLRAETAYFYTEGGGRTGLVFFDMADPSDMPPLLEPLFGELDATLELTPVMNADDLKAGLQRYAAMTAAV